LISRRKTLTINRPIPAENRSSLSRAVDGLRKCFLLWWTPPRCPCMPSPVLLATRTACGLLYLDCRLHAYDYFLTSTPLNLWSAIGRGRTYDFCCKTTCSFLPTVVIVTILFVVIGLVFVKLACNYYCKLDFCSYSRPYVLLPQML
jgi:hypothetical protein